MSTELRLVNQGTPYEGYGYINIPERIVHGRGTYDRKNTTFEDSIFYNGSTPSDAIDNIMEQEGVSHERAAQIYNAMTKLKDHVIAYSRQYADNENSPEAQEFYNQVLMEDIRALAQARNEPWMLGQDGKQYLDKQISYYKVPENQRLDNMWQQMVEEEWKFANDYHNAYNYQRGKGMSKEALDNIREHDMKAHQADMLRKYGDLYNHFINTQGTISQGYEKIPSLVDEELQKKVNETQIDAARNNYFTIGSGIQNMSVDPTNRDAANAYFNYGVQAGLNSPLEAAGWAAVGGPSVPILIATAAGSRLGSEAGGAAGGWLFDKLGWNKDLGTVTGGLLGYGLGMKYGSRGGSYLNDQYNFRQTTPSYQSEFSVWDPRRYNNSEFRFSVGPYRTLEGTPGYGFRVGNYGIGYDPSVAAMGVKPSIGRTRATPSTSTADKVKTAKAWGKYLGQMAKGLGQLTKEFIQSKIPNTFYDSEGKSWGIKYFNSDGTVTLESIGNPARGELRVPISELQSRFTSNSGQKYVTGLNGKVYTIDSVDPTTGSVTLKDLSRTIKKTDGANFDRTIVTADDFHDNYQTYEIPAKTEFASQQTFASAQRPASRAKPELAENDLVQQFNQGTLRTASIDNVQPGTVLTNGKNKWTVDRIEGNKVILTDGTQISKRQLRHYTTTQEWPRHREGTFIEDDNGHIGQITKINSDGSVEVTLPDGNTKTMSVSEINNSSIRAGNQPKATQQPQQKPPATPLAQTPQQKPPTTPTTSGTPAKTGKIQVLDNGTFEIDGTIYTEAELDGLTGDFTIDENGAPYVGPISKLKPRMKYQNGNLRFNQASAPRTPPAQTPEPSDPINPTLNANDILTTGNNAGNSGNPGNVPPQQPRQQPQARNNWWDDYVSDDAELSVYGDAEGLAKTRRLFNHRVVKGVKMTDGKTYNVYGQKGNSILLQDRETGKLTGWLDIDKLNSSGRIAKVKYGRRSWLQSEIPGQTNDKAQLPTADQKIGGKSRYTPDRSRLRDRWLPWLTKSSIIGGTTWAGLNYLYGDQIGNMWDDFNTSKETKQTATDLNQKNTEVADSLSADEMEAIDQGRVEELIGKKENRQNLPESESTPEYVTIDDSGNAYINLNLPEFATLLDSIYNVKDSKLDPRILQLKSTVVPGYEEYNPEADADSIDREIIKILRPYIFAGDGKR